MRLLVHVWPAALFLLSVPLGAQEVRRARPATSPLVPKALPVNPGDAPSSLILEPNIRPNVGRSFKRDPAPASAGSAAEPDTKGRDTGGGDEIRLTPGNGAAADSGDPAAAQLGIADGLYLRKLYDLAAPEYEKYLGQYEDNQGRAVALYRLADCYGKLGQEAAALNTYRILVDEVGQGEVVGSAAFRLATRCFEEKAYPDAAPFYAKAYDNARSPEIRITARYYEAKCLELANRRFDAKAVYEDVRRVKDKNPYRDAASLSLAYFALESNQRPEALARFDELSLEAQKPAVRAEALTRAGILSVDLKQRDKAEKYFKDAIALNAEGKWKEVAQLELMKLQYDSDKFSQVLEAYARNSSGLAEETRPTVLLLVANSFRQLGRHQKALEVYSQLIRQYPNTTDAADARYQRLISLDAVKDPTLVSEVDGYLATTPARDRADKAKLLKAQALVQQSKYQAAARLYLELGDSSLPAPYRADCFYAAGYSLSQVNDTVGAIEAFTGLIQKYPRYKMISKALLKRGLLYQSERNYPAALHDLNDVLAEGSGSPERETALLQKGLILGQEQDYPRMSSTFQQLLKEYPGSSAAAQANYWIGWAAFEGKQYSAAVEPLAEARRLNPQEYGEKVALRLIYCNEVLNRPDDVGREIDEFVQQDPKRVTLVSEACKWVGVHAFEAKNYAAAAKYLGLIAKSEERSHLDPATWLMLGRADLEEKQFSDAIEAVNAYLVAVTDPAERAQGFLALGHAQLGAIQADAANKSAEQALTLQPEGRLNAEARMLIGDIEASRGNYENAARSYLSVAVLYEDPEVTPHALEAAYQAFQKAGNQDQAGKTLSELKSRYPSYEIRLSTS